MKKPKVRAKMCRLGVNIIDQDGSMLAGITERDAIDLYESLKRLMPNIKKLAKIMEPL